MALLSHMDILFGQNTIQREPIKKKKKRLHGSTKILNDNHAVTIFIYVQD